VGDVYGVVRARLAWHDSKDCPRIREQLKAATTVLVRYESEDAAFKAGHCQPCQVCRGGVLVECGDNLFMRLTVEQIDTLKQVKRLAGQSAAPLAISSIAAARQRGTSTVTRAVNMMVDRGLLGKRRPRTGRKAPNYSIVLTSLGHRVLSKLHS